jgi:cyclopropane fatty-acyl-phospholipid synthase-like methyltransferase
MSQPAWSLELYELQHEIWPSWSASEGDAEAAMSFLVRWLGLEAGAHVLDLGCGVGRELVALARRGLRPVGVDISARLVERARARIRDAGVAARATTGDLLAPDQPGPFELIMAWDSTLNIFCLETAIAALERWLPALAPGGRVCVQQLHAPYWRRQQAPFVLEGEGVGPGRSVRRYRVEGSRLFDEVSHRDRHGHARELPTQALQLYPIAELEAALAGLGLVEVHSVGSEGLAWTEPCPVDERAAMVITSGSLP